MIERWVAVPGFEGLYEVSDAGRVRSLDRIVRGGYGASRIARGRILRPAAMPKLGHRLVSLWSDGDQTMFLVHRLVLMAFVGQPEPGMQACHNNGDPSDNRLANLRWDTASGNVRDAVRHGTHGSVRKTHCPRGHEYDAANTKISAGKRYCKACAAEWQRARRARRRAS